MRDYELLKQIGRRVRRQREALGYTRDDIAGKLDISVNFCSDIELGKKGMSVDTLSRMAKVLRVSVDYIVNGTTAANDTSAITAMLESCEKEKLHYLEEIIKTFIKAME